MTRPLLIACLCWLAVPAAWCQKTEKYFDYQWQETDALHARFYSLIERTDSGWHRRDYFIHSLTLQMEGWYADSACKVRSGKFRFVHPNRMIESAGLYQDGRKQGLWLTYYSDGSLADSTVYVNGAPVGVSLSWHRNGYMRDSANFGPDGSGVRVAWFDNGNPSYAGRFTAGFKKIGKWNYFHKTGGVSETETYDTHGQLLDKLPDTSNTDAKAAFPGGPKAWSAYLSRALYFPEQYTFTNGDEATVVIEATIGEDGRVEEAEVAVPFYPAFDRIALNALLHSPRWTPAVDHHRKVRAVIRQPVTFSQPEQ